MVEPSPMPRAFVASAETEAARYALLRRLAPSMRHHLVVNLQPIGMIYEVMERRLRAAEPDLAQVQDSATKINGFARAALASCLDVVSWLAPDDTVATGVEDAVRECAALLATSLSFRGYALRNEAQPLPGKIRRAAIRSLLTGVLLHCTDEKTSPSDLVLGTAGEEGGALLTVTVRPTDGDKGMAPDANYRKITWADLQALAAADDVQLARQGEQFLLRFPWVA
ncbi:MAG TPA: hypothetical protein VGD76_17580 [Ramlibacter sp.]